nr:DUF5086 family protein [Pseudomonas aeruginosa]
MRPVLPLLLSLSLCAPALADWSGPIEQPLWSLPAAPGLSRWLIVHNLSSAAADGLYHVEVLERRQGQQPWQFQRLAAHLALTEQALRASIVAPLKRGGCIRKATSSPIASGRNARPRARRRCAGARSTSACGRRTEPGYLGRIMLNVSRVWL